MPDDLFCSALYKTYLFYPRDHAGYIAQQIALAILSIVIIIGSYLWLRSRAKLMSEGNIDKANGVFIYIYRSVIVLYILVMSVQLFGLLLYIFVIDVSSMIPQKSASEQILYSIVYALPNFQMSLIVFLFTKNTLSQRAFTRALKISIPFGILWFLLSLLGEFNIVLSSISLLVVYCIFLLCCLLLLFRQCSYHWPRKRIIINYVSFIMIIAIINIFLCALQANKEDALCFNELYYYIWFLLYPPVFFKTIKDDSDYWWKSASRPLLESTQETLQGIDLFALPPNHHMHFVEKTTNEDDSDEFNPELTQIYSKLSQIVSSHVRMIDFDKIKFKDNNIQNNNKVIGKGSTSKVYVGKWKRYDVAVKKMEVRNFDKNNQMNWTDLTLVFRESILSSTIQHLNIVKFHGCSITPDCFYLIYEYCVYGDLQQIVVENSHPQNPNLKSIYQRLFYLKDIAEGMSFLHSHEFVHRDLKTANVVVCYHKKKQRYLAKICDFGVSRKTNIKDIQLIENDERKNDIANVINQQYKEDFDDDQIQTFDEIERTIDVGTPAFLAPEILLKLVSKKGIRWSQSDDPRKQDSNPLIFCDFATDVFSYGMILWSLITAKLPYKGYKPMDMILMIKKGKRLKITESEWNEWKPYVSDLKNLKLLLDSSWSQHSTQRPTFTQICTLLKEIAQEMFD